MISWNAPARFPQLGEVAYFQCFGLLLQYSFRISTISDLPNIAKLFTSPFPPQLSTLNPFPSLILFSVEKCLQTGNQKYSPMRTLTSEPYAV